MTTEEDGSNKNENTTETVQSESNTVATNTVAMDNQYFYEDLVYKVTDKKVSFGMVIHNDSDSYSDEEDLDSPPLQKGTIKVSWYPQGSEQIVKEQAVGLADRSLMPGDVVRRIDAPKSSSVQHGYCREIIVYVNAQQVNTKNVLPSIPNTRLLPLDQFEPDFNVCLGPWVGQIKEHRTQLKIAMMSCNPLTLVANVIGRFELTHTNVCNLKPTEKRRWTVTSYGACEHYIGQILTAKPAELKQVRWLSGAKELLSSKKKHHLVIEDMQTVGVGVRWSYQGVSDELQDTVPMQPEYLITGEKLKSLKMLHVFDTCTCQIGDRRYLIVDENDIIETKSKWLKRQAKIYCGKDTSITTDNNAFLKPPDTNFLSDLIINENLCQDDEDDEDWSTEESDNSSVTNSGSSGRVTPTPITGKKSPVLATKVLKKKMKKDRKLRPKIKSVSSASEPPKPGQRILIETLSTSSFATVVWQDGTIEKNIPSTKLYPIHHLDDQEFFPGDFVIRNNSLSGEQDLRDYGVVQYMNHAARTAFVKWFRTYAAASNANCGDSSPTLHGEEEVSVYDLKDHPDFNFRPGTIVIKVAGHSNMNPGAGQVLDNFPEGCISVQWVDGSKSKCWPQDLYNLQDIGDSDDDDIWGEDDDEDDDDDELNSLEITQDASWETQSEESVPCDTTEASTKDATLRLRLATNIERSCDAMARLENMFARNPALQGKDVMRKLLDVYKGCRYLDRLMGTTIFHEQHFSALLERAKTRPSASQQIRMHIQRLFSSEGEASTPQSPENTSAPEANLENSSLSLSFSQMEASSSDPAHSSNTSNASEHEKISYRNKSENILTNTIKLLQKQAEAEKFIRDNADNWKCCGSDSTIEPIAKTAEILSNIVNVQDSVKQAFDKENKINSNKKINEKGVPITSTPADMALHMTKESGDKTVKTLYLRDFAPSNKTIVASSPNTSATSSTPASAAADSTANLNACRALCAIIKSRLVITHAEVLKRLGTADFIHELRTGADENETNIESSPIKSPAEETISASSNISSSVDIDQSKESAKDEEGFTMLERAPTSHKYHLSVIQPPSPQAWISAVRREFKLLSRALPPGVWVRGYEDRLDILSVMIRGPADTPYEDGLFLFDVQLGVNYPSSPPLFHYISYCTDRLNPNLYEEGKVCVSLLGTWSGRGSEVWGPNSTLLQVIVSIQGLILNAEPYFNEAGYEKQKSTALGQENSRMYNEMATLKLVQSMTKLLQSPPDVFKNEIYEHFKQRGFALLTRLENLLVGADEYSELQINCNKFDIGAATTSINNSVENDITSEQNLTPTNNVPSTEDSLTENKNISNENSNFNGTLTEKNNLIQISIDLSNQTNTTTAQNVPKTQQISPVAMITENQPATTVVDTNCIENQQLHSSTITKQANKCSRTTPAFPLFPTSKGFCLSLKSALPIFKRMLIKLELIPVQQQS